MPASLCRAGVDVLAELLSKPVRLSVERVLSHASYCLRLVDSCQEYRMPYGAASGEIGLYQLEPGKASESWRVRRVGGG